MGDAALDRVNPQFFNNTAELYILRVDWHLHQDWEAVLEGRALTMPDLNQTRSGLLVAGYRHFGKNVKAGLGYNFTNFSEESDRHELQEPRHLHERCWIDVALKSVEHILLSRRRTSPDKCRILALHGRGTRVSRQGLMTSSLRLSGTEL